MSLEKKIIEAYADGSELSTIIRSLNTTHKKVIDTLTNFREENREKRTFTEEFKKVIASRDIRGITRKAISKELGINATTVKRACEAFGQSVKGVAKSDNEYIRIEVDGEFDLSKCPSCKSESVNEVDDLVIYCMDCGLEHEFHTDYEYKYDCKCKKKKDKCEKEECREIISVDKYILKLF